MAEGPGIGFYDDAARTCRAVVQILQSSQETEDTSVSDERPLPFDSSRFTLDDHSGLRYVPAGRSAGLGLWALFSGCGGKVDLCGVLEKGDCGDWSGSMSIQVETPPPYAYDIAAWTREALSRISAANHCVLDGLNGISFAKMAEKGSYLVERRKIEIDPTQFPSAVTTVDKHWLVMKFRLFHEVGHHIFHYVMPTLCDSLQSRFAEISWRENGAMRPEMNPDVDTGDFLNADAIKNADEDFAVCLSYYFVFPDEFRTRAASSAALARKYEAIKSLLQGTEY